MPQVLLVNPSPRKGVRKMAKKARSAAQRAATKKLVALNRSRRAGRAAPKRRRSRVVARKANPIHRAHRAAAPARRRKRRAGTSVAVARRVMRHRRRRNPTGIMSDVMNMLVPSAIGGAGALGLDVLMGVLPLPDTIKTGPMRPVVRIAGAIGLGMLAGHLGSKQMGKQVATGALTVVMYDTLKGLLSKVAGGKIPGLSVYEIPGVGMYEVTPAADAVGYYDAGMQVGTQDNTLPTGMLMESQDGIYR